MLYRLPMEFQACSATIELTVFSPSPAMASAGSPPGSPIYLAIYPGGFQQFPVKALAFWNICSNFSFFSRCHLCNEDKNAIICNNNFGTNTE